MCCRARTPKHFQACANMIIKKKSAKKIVTTTKSNNLQCFHICCFFVAIRCRNKKILSKYCSTIKENFLFQKNFSKSLSNVSSDPGHMGVNLDMNYVFTSILCYVGRLFHINTCGGNIDQRVLIGILLAVRWISFIIYTQYFLICLKQKPFIENYSFSIVEKTMSSYVLKVHQRSSDSFKK